MFGCGFPAKHPWVGMWKCGVMGPVRGPRGGHQVLGTLLMGSTNVELTGPEGVSVLGSGMLEGTWCPEISAHSSPQCTQLAFSGGSTQHQIFCDHDTKQRRQEMSGPSPTHHPAIGETEVRGRVTKKKVFSCDLENLSLCAPSCSEHQTELKRLMPP